MFLSIISSFTAGNYTQKRSSTGDVRRLFQDDHWVNIGQLDTKSLSPAPLISEISITKDIHLTVLQKMELGKIASKEEVEK